MNYCDRSFNIDIDKKKRRGGVASLKDSLLVKTSFEPTRKYTRDTPITKFPTYHDNEASCRVSSISGRIRRTPGASKAGVYI